MSAAVENLLGEDRHQYRIGHPRQAYQGDQQQDAPDRPESEGVDEAFSKFMNNIQPLLPLMRYGVKTHRDERHQYRQVAGAVQDEADPFADRGDQKPGNGRADKPGAVYHGR